MHEHAAKKRTGRQAQPARLPWAQPARQAARVGAEWHETQTPSPADKWDKQSRQLGMPQAAGVQQEERLTPETRLPWAQPDRGTASE